MSGDRLRRALLASAALRVVAAKLELHAARMRVEAAATLTGAQMSAFADAWRDSEQRDFDATLVGHPDVAELDANLGYWFPGA